jgi:peptide-methionine (S)-S-oxide reductase
VCHLTGGLNRFRGAPGLCGYEHEYGKDRMLNFTRKASTDRGRVGPGSREGLPESAERATFAAGCFWGVEASFREIEGVLKTTVGYTGGTVASPSYEQVCSGTTGHAEAVEIWFDPTVVSYEDLLSTFWTIHDPTSINRQGWDFGSQYRSAIFFGDADQERQAIASRDEHQASLTKEIATQIAAAGEYYDAEDYHQRYFEKHGGAVCATTLR